MKVLLLGATGRTGKIILEQLLASGHAVHALVRDKQKVGISSDLLTVFESSALNQKILDLAMTGCEAVISALNVSRKNDIPWSALRSSKTLMSDTMGYIIKSANHHRIKRVIVISAWGVNETINDIPWWFRWLISHSNIKYAYLDHERQERLLAASGLYWTAIRPVGLINATANKPIVVTFNNKPEPSLIISRKAVAHFAVEVLKQAEFIGLAPVISW